MFDVNMIVKIKSHVKVFEDTQTDRHTDFFKKAKSDIRKVF